jgi:germacradienol/geosmin synthase
MQPFELLANHIKNRIPDPVDYIEMRRKTFGSGLTMSLARLGCGQEIPPEIYQTRPMRGLDNSAADFAGLTNDIFSYQKEIQFEGELNNGVLVVQNFLGCGLLQATEIINDLMAARMRQFERIVATDLPAMFDEFGLDDRARRILNGYAEQLQYWMAGVLEWHRLTRRYDESQLRYQPAAAAPVGGPTGLGTALARIGTLRTCPGGRAPGIPPHRGPAASAAAVLCCPGGRPPGIPPHRGPAASAAAVEY